MKIDLIKPYSKNAKKHPSVQVEQIAASIKEFEQNIGTSGKKIIKFLNS